MLCWGKWLKSRKLICLKQWILFLIILQFMDISYSLIGMWLMIQMVSLIHNCRQPAWFRRESVCLLCVVSDSPIGNPRLFFTWAISGFQIVVGKQDPMHKRLLTSTWVTFANVHWIKQGKWWRPDTKHEVLDFTSWWEGWESDIRVVHKGMKGIFGNFCTLPY